MEPIHVTYDEYCAIGFSLFIFGMLVTMQFLFPAPDEREKNDDEDF